MNRPERSDPVGTVCSDTSGWPAGPPLFLF